MTHEEAINEIKSWDFLNEKEIEVIQTLIPELRESEDEKIRKAIIELLKEVEEDETYTGRQHIPDMLAYLEKQKEQKPNIELIQRSWYMEGYHDREFGKEPMWIIKTGEGGPKHELNPKYGQPLADEQKPADYCSVRDEFDLDGNLKQKPAEKPDYSELTDLERAIHRGFLVAGVENVPVTIIKETAQDCLAHMHAEWSEEDEKIYQHCLIILHDYGYDEWFKSLRPQPKEEWSEEDERIKSCIGLALTDVDEQRFKDFGTTLKDCLAWLKSIRPSWKPSEGQMNCLCAAVDAAIRKHNESVSGYKPARVLKSLYEDLQKL